MLICINSRVPNRYDRDSDSTNESSDWWPLTNQRHWFGWIFWPRSIMRKIFQLRAPRHRYGETKMKSTIWSSSIDSLETPLCVSLSLSCWPFIPSWATLHTYNAKTTFSRNRSLNTMTIIIKFQKWVQYTLTHTSQYGNHVVPAISSLPSDHAL